jgi:molecular chaperone HtpG
MAEHRFQIDLRGIIDLLSNHLYSGPQVFVRELLQNGVDAIRARDRVDPGHAGSITIEVHERRGEQPPAVTFVDDGIGLSEDEIHRFLATIGESSKRGALDGTRDFIGQFGIGVLSGFVVSDEIRLVTRSTHGDAAAIEWRGRPDGTYSVERLGIELPVGTRVHLRCKPGYEAYFGAERIRDLAAHYGGLLPCPIRVHDRDGTRTVNEDAPPWRVSFASPRQQSAAYLEYGRRTFEQELFDWIPLRSEVGGVRGVAYVLPFAAAPTIRGSHRIYLKGMLLCEDAQNLLPDWAFFVRAIVDADELRPTASREAFYEDATLEATRDDLGEQLRTWLLELARDRPARFEQLIALHHTSMKALATTDDEFFSIIMDLLPFESTTGRTSFGEYRARNPLVRYVPTVDQFRRIAQVAHAQGLEIINGGYAYDSELMERFGRMYADARVEQVDSRELSEEFAELTLDERQRIFELVRLADVVLQPYKCQADVKHFRPVSMPALYTTSTATDFRRDIERTRDVSSPLWSSVLENLAAARPGSDMALLCLNYDNPIVARLARAQAPDRQRLAIEMLYVHALLLGHHPLSNREVKLLDDSLLGLVELAVGGPERA